MSMTDPIADLLTRIRNANKALLPNVAIPHSRFKEDIARVLKEEGYIKAYETVGEGAGKNLVIILKYTAKKERTIEVIAKISKPGHRRYVAHDGIKPIRGGMGIAILSTPKGVLTDTSARQQKVGGEWICTVW
ncbi:MAG: 30S ribosomal protein S8 [Deltaproteobacteria bacterium CG11_big_fil_rev_8_21_14_0_20_49_13]|nr:MAG: 30S ribosomal protein S8 [Deltaproteobacteria bacterium CG11_big_fil_rev_8_21_14_0_20_49_13]